MTAVVLVGLAVAGCGSTATAAPAAPGPSVGQPLDQPLPSAVLGASLVSSSGQPVSLASFSGKIVVISDVMTLCQETCPLDTANVVAAARSVQKAGLAGDVEFLSITVDPTRDTVARLAAYQSLFPDAPSNWLTLTGPAPTLAALWKFLGVYTEKVPEDLPAAKDWLTGRPLTYDIDHSDEVFAVDGTGHERFILEGAPTINPGTPIPPTLTAFLSAQGREDVAHPDALAWTMPQELQVLSWLTGHTVQSTGDNQ
ncbi:protein SCO1/2 [Nakamurella sp. UYEF19]|uniref:SCO family protein n=1 Tax=Nakamurella sp. UYEF19 TaxID=1756392 RepID=UPI0033918934